MSCRLGFVNKFRFVCYLCACILFLIFLNLKFDISKIYSIIADMTIKILFPQKQDFGNYIGYGGVGKQWHFCVPREARRSRFRFGFF